MRWQRALERLLYDEEGDGLGRQPAGRDRHALARLRQGDAEAPTTSRCRRRARRARRACPAAPRPRARRATAHARRSSRAGRPPAAASGTTTACVASAITATPRPSLPHRLKQAVEPPRGVHAVVGHGVVEHPALTHCAPPPSPRLGGLVGPSSRGRELEAAHHEQPTAVVIATAMVERARGRPAAA